MVNVVQKFHPTLNKVYFVNTYSLFHIRTGSGAIQVDFKNYEDWQDKAIYLEKGQYIKFLSDDFSVRKIEFPSQKLFHNKDVRVLFEHLISLGYINFNECEACQQYLSSTVFSEHTGDIIDISSKQWYWQNPFHASKGEYQVIFDVKEIIDREYHNHLGNAELAALIAENGFEAQALVKNKLGLSVKALLANKRLVESQKEMAFTDKSAQEVSYEMGFKDPAYFNRVFKQKTGQSPTEFRKNFDYQNRDTFIQNILQLLRTYHTEQRSLAFYADKMHLSVKALSKKTRQKLNTSLGQLLRNELVITAKGMLREGAPVKEVAFALGFKEANHFSSFFKKQTGQTPSYFKQ